MKIAFAVCFICFILECDLFYNLFSCYNFFVCNKLNVVDLISFWWFTFSIWVSSYIVCFFIFICIYWFLSLKIWFVIRIINNVIKVFIFQFNVKINVIYFIIELNIFITLLASFSFISITFVSCSSSLFSLRLFKYGANVSLLVFVMSDKLSVIVSYAVSTDVFV